MNIDFPGVMTEFAAVQPGDFFIYFEDDGPAFGMKTSLPDKTAAVISFSAAVHAGVPPPNHARRKSVPKQHCLRLAKCRHPSAVGPQRLTQEFAFD